MKSAEVSADVEILSSIYLFWKASVSFRPERLAASSWAMEFPHRSSFMILLSGGGSLFEITKIRL